MTNIEIYLTVIVVILVIWKLEHMKKLEKIHDELEGIREQLESANTANLDDVY